MTGHWSARGWQGWGDASESEERGQVHVEASKPHLTPLSSIIQVSQLHFKKCHVTLNPLAQGGLSWAHPSLLGTQKPSPTFCISYPLSVSASLPKSWPQVSNLAAIYALAHRSLARCPSVHPGSMVRNNLRGHQALPSVSQPTPQTNINPLWAGTCRVPLHPPPSLGRQHRR